MQVTNPMRFLTGLLLTLTLVACQPVAPATTETATETAAPAKAAATTSNAASEPGIFDVVKADGTTQPFSLEQLKALPVKTIMADGKPQEGPAILDVLAAVGVSDFQKVTIAGAGSVTLSKDEVTAEVILDFNNHGTVKLASPALPIPSPVKEVKTITVE